jgi:ligand-binding sensor domain-containing protein
MKLSSVILLFLIAIILSCKKEVPNPDNSLAQTLTYKTYTSNNSPLVNISTDNLKCLEIDDKNNVWIGTRDAVGLLKYTPSSDIWVNYDKADFGADIWAILDIDFSLDGTLWIGTNGGVFKYSNNSFTKVLIDSSGFPSSWVSTIHVDQQDRVWASLNGNLYKLENNKWSYLTEYDSLGYQIQDFKSDSQGNLWIGTFQGLIKFDGTSFNLMNHQAVSSKMNIYNINIDNEDGLIIGCNGGLFRFSEPHWSIIQPPVFQQPLWDIREWIVATIVTNDTSNIYGAWNVGLAIDNETKFNFLRGSEFQMDTNRFQINQLKYDNFENLWIGTRFGEVIVYNPSGLNF